MEGSRKTLLASAQEDFEFPLAEAARKQVYALAETLRDRGEHVEILIITPRRSGRSVRNGIPVREVTRRELLRCGPLLRSFDRIQYFGTIGVVAAVVSMLAPSIPKTFTATDGSVFSIGPRSGARRFFARWFHRFYDSFQTYTDYQQRLLLAVSPSYAPKLEMVRPILSQPVPIVSHDERSGVLYLGHLSRFKGLDIVMEIYRRLADEIPGLTLTIAANGLSYDSSLDAEVQRLIAEYPGRVELKGKVNVLEELSAAALLIYPIRSHAGTFAVPLSLCESMICGTPFLSSRLVGLTEYFEDCFLCEPENLEQFVARARAMLTSPADYRANIERNLHRLTQNRREHEHSS